MFAQHLPVIKPSQRHRRTSLHTYISHIRSTEITIFAWIWQLKISGLELVALVRLHCGAKREFQGVTIVL